MQFVVFEKFTSAYYTKLLENACYYMLIVNMKKKSESLDRWNFWKCACAICNLRLCYNFALLLHENVLIFSQLEVLNFFMHIITSFPFLQLYLLNGQWFIRLREHHHLLIENTVLFQRPSNHKSRPEGFGPNRLPGKLEVLIFVLEEIYLQLGLSKFFSHPIICSQVRGTTSSLKVMVSTSQSD